MTRLKCNHNPQVLSAWINFYLTGESLGMKVNVMEPTSHSVINVRELMSCLVKVINESRDVMSF